MPKLWLQRGAPGSSARIRDFAGGSLGITKRRCTRDGRWHLYNHGALHSSADTHPAALEQPARSVASRAVSLPPGHSTAQLGMAQRGTAQHSMALLGTAQPQVAAGLTPMQAVSGSPELVSS